jgi:hypothetical protein
VIKIGRALKYDPFYPNIGLVRVREASLALTDIQKQVQGLIDG